MESSRYFKCLTMGVKPQREDEKMGLSVATFVAILISRLRKKNPDFCKFRDVELQHLSIRTRSKIKTFSEDSLGPFDTQTIDTPPYKMVVETYEVEELKKATKDMWYGYEEPMHCLLLLFLDMEPKTKDLS
ncbi:hypothetical protein IFM89_017703 [Coptis chinensis]|uniref:Uncharacterized protein n=1 Tax=Coptis chinensis TaxID=261450 RepID=A0A835LVD1_9MAGN|nr:hypothetical protein IFM89_017703 [Coptis chinensis]